MGFLKLKYRLTREETEETLLVLDQRREGIFKTVNLGILSILGVAVLIAYMRNPGHIFLAFQLLMIILLLFYLWYGPQHRRKKTAEKMLKEGGSYQIVIGDGYIAAADHSRRTELGGGKWKCCISEHMYILKAGREIYAIPKRILGRAQEEKLTGLAKMYGADIVHIVIKKE